MKNLETLILELCPDGVEFVKIGDFCIRNKGISITAAKMKEINKAGAPVRIFAAGNTKADVEYEDIDSKSVVFSPSVIVKSRGNIGFEYYDKPFSHKTEMWSYTSKDCDKLDIKFLFYYLSSLTEKFQAKARANAVKLPQLSIGDTDKFEIPLPPIEVQTEIVRILDKFTSLEAELEAELDCRKRQYEYYRDKLLSFDNVGGQEVEWKKMSEVCEIYDGTHQTPKYQTEGIPFISVENIKDIYGSNKYISIEAYEAYKVKPKVGDVFMTRIGSIGACAVFTKQEDVAYYVSLALLRPNSAILDSRFLKHLIESSIGKRELSKRTLHNAVPIKINKSDIGKVKLPVPSLPEQERIANILDRFESLTTSLQSGLPAEIAARRQQYEHYRDKLLTFKRKVAA